MKQSNLFEEIDKIVRGRIDANEPTPATWLAGTVVKKHPHIQGQDANWYRFCASEHVREVVRRSLRRYKPEAQTEMDEQLLLPGFDRLQKVYLVSRRDEQMIVPINQLTDEEIRSKITELTAMAEGCQEHIKELRRYLARRKRIEKQAA